MGKRKFFISKGILLSSRLILGIVFIIAGFYKSLNPHIFEKALNNYNLFPDVINHFIAISFPWIELFLGGLLISGFLSRYIAFVTITRLC